MQSRRVIADASVLDGWRKSSYSGGSNGNCLEIADGLTTLVPVRDSKNPHGPAVVFPAEGWTAFVGAVRDGSL